MPEIKNYGIHHFCLPFPSGKGLFILFNLIYLKRFRNGVFHVTGHDHYAVLALPKKQTILTIHDLIFLKTYRGWKRTLLRWFLLDLPVKHCMYITTVSEKTKLEILSCVKCDPAKIWVIPNPVMQLWVNDTIKIISRNPVLLFVGSTSNKNLQNLIPALHGLKVHLRIIGSVTLREVELLNKFDVVYCSATIEHLGSYQNQLRALKEMNRISKKYLFLTTPNRFFPIEMHTKIPFLHFLPKKIFRAIIRFLGDDFFCHEKNLNLLSIKDVIKLCKNAQIKNYEIMYNYFLFFKSNIILIAKKY